MRADPAIQFAPIPPPSEPVTPGWARALVDAIARLADALGPLGSVVFWVLVAVGAAALAVLLWRLAGPLLARREAAGVADGQDGWTPDRAEAEALLDDADRLAAEGRFDEAAHLLLQRSVQQIRAVRPEWLAPSSTAREIAGLAALPDAARRAFATIAERVERGLFALRPLGPVDWQAARTAYADFALARF